MKFLNRLNVRLLPKLFMFCQLVLIIVITATDFRPSIEFETPNDFVGAQIVLSAQFGPSSKIEQPAPKS